MGSFINDVTQKIYFRPPPPQSQNFHTKFFLLYESVTQRHQTQEKISRLEFYSEGSLENFSVQKPFGLGQRRKGGLKSTQSSSSAKGITTSSTIIPYVEKVKNT